MGLTKPRAHQLQDIDYKQTTRAVTTSNITLSGGAPATVDGVSLALRDRVLVTGQSTGSENGIYYVTTVGAGSNGTWARSLDADTTGEVNAGMIIMITEGTTYADTQWVLTTDDPITIGTTALTFVRNGSAAYGTIAVSGQNSIVADQVGDVLTMVAGTNLALTTNDSTDTLTITPSLTPAVTSLTASGNITGGNIITTGTVDVDRLSLTSSQTTVSPLQLTANSLQDGVGALRIDGSQADIYLNPATATHTTVTFAVNNDQRLAFGMDNNSDFYITRRTGNVWYDDTFVIDRDTGELQYGYDLSVAGTLTGTTATFTNTTTDDSILVTTTENSSSAAPVITLKRNSASVADADYLGQLKFKGENDADQEVVYAKITAKIQDASDGSEDGLIEFANRKAGSNTITARLRSDSLQLLNGTSLVVAGLTYPTSDGTNGQVLQTNGSGTLSFADASGGGATVSSDTTTNAERLIYVGSTTSGTLSAVTQDSGLTYNPSTGSLTSAAFIGTVTTAAQTNITSVGTLTSLGVTNNITVGGTVDGRDIATDGTKLDGIEASADVTDATNVAAAGAAMTSNNLSDLSNASTARTNLGVAIGSNVQAYDADLTAIGGLAKTDSNFIVGNGSTWVAESGATARASLGLTIGTDVQAYSSVLQNTTASFVTADETKLDYISVTQAVDLDQMETDIAALANGMVYKGNWDASAGSFPGSGSAQTGWFYYVSVAGTVDGISFAVGDNIVATTDNASTTTYAGNWSKHDQTDAVQAVVGLTGSIAKSSLLSALNVEDGADVTDSTNVTAAGALMDSEVTNLAQVKAFDSSDYATAAQGTTADAALPKAGGTMTGNVTFGDNDKAIFGAGSDLQIYHDGTDSYMTESATGSLYIGADSTIALTDAAVTQNKAQFITGGAVNLFHNNALKLATTATGVDVTGSITVSGTVDGRDVATDGTKLDGIAAGATNVTNNNQLTNGAGYTTNAGDITNVSVSGTGLSGGGASGSVTITSNATSANTGSTIVARDGSGNFSAGVITATATAARYADLAEKYTSDVQYPPGTVVVLGGEAEVTRSDGPTSRAIAGIVSTDPAYLMNNDLEGDTVVDVALIGRVPCMVTGIINKGDLLVSSSRPGHACAWTNATNPPAGSIVGKAIENKTDEDPGVIEVLVGRL